MMMGKFVIASEQTWRVVCKDCLCHASFNRAEAAQDWMFGHDKDCTGTHR